jgi:hypothetical protein
VKVIGFEAMFRRRSLWKQDFENAPGNAHHTSYSPPNSTTDCSGFQRASGESERTWASGMFD